MKKFLALFLLPLFLMLSSFGGNMAKAATFDFINTTGPAVSSFNAPVNILGLGISGNVINFAGGGGSNQPTLNFNQGGSQFYDNGHLHIATDDYLYLDAPAATILQSGLYVNGSSTFYSPMNVLGMGISGNVINFAGGGLPILNFNQGGSQVYDNGQMHVSTDDYLYLDAPQTVYVQNGLRISGTTWASGYERHDGLADFNGGLNTTNLSAAGQTNLGNLTATGALSLPNGSVTGAMLASNLIASSNIQDNAVTDAKVVDALTINGGVINNTSIGATTPSSGNFTGINVGGNSTLNNLSVAGTVSLPNNSVTDAMVADNITIAGFLPLTGGTLTGIVNFNENVNVAAGKTLDVNGTLDVTGATMLGVPNYSTIGDGTIGGNLSVAGTSTLTGLLTANGGLNVAGALTLPANSVTDAMVSNTLTASDLVAGVSVVSDSEVDNNLTINGGAIDNTVIGATTRAAGNFTNLDINGTLALPANSVTDAMVPDTITVSNYLPLAGGTLTGLLTANNGLTVTGAVTLPNNSITDAMVVDTLTASNYLPLGGGTLTGALNGTTGTFSGLLTANNGLTVVGALALPANSVTDAMVSDTLTASNFVGAGSLTNAIDLATAEVNGILADANVADNITASNYLPLAGGTLTGALNGTTGSFSGLLTANGGLTVVGALALPANSVTDAMVSNTLTASDLVAGASVVSDAEVDDNLTISGGTINNTPIGAVTPSTASFTNLTVSGVITFPADSITDAMVSNTLTSSNFVGAGSLTNAIDLATAEVSGVLADANVADNITALNYLPLVGGTLTGALNGTTGTFSGLLTANSGLTVAGALSLPNDSVTDAMVSNTLTSSNFVGTGSTTNAVDLGTAEVNGTLADINIADNITINGGTIDNTVIGATTRAAGNFTNLDVNGTVTLPANSITDAMVSNTLTASDLVAGVSVVSDSEVDNNLTINGGAIDNTVIGATTRAAGNFTNLDVNGTLVLPANSVTDAMVVDTLTASNYLPLAGGTLTGALNGTTGTFSGLLTANGGLTVAGALTLPANSVTDAMVSDTLTASNLIAGGSVISDAEVDDNLTLSGGTINNTPIGGITPSSANFTTVNASGAVAFNGNTTIGDNVADTLTVNATPTFNENVIVDTANLTLQGASNLNVGGNLSVTGTSNLTGLLTSNGGITVAGAVTLPNDSVTDAMVSNTLTSSNFVGAGSTTNAIDLATSEVAGILADANVADNLTISGGTINNTPIGATVRAAGNFTNLDANGVIALPNNSITDAMIPDTITASNYLPLVGGTLTGTLNGTNALFSGNGSFGGALAATGATNLSGLLTANGGAVVQGQLTTGGVIKPTAALGNLQLMGANASPGRVEVWDRMSISNGHLYGSFPDPGAGGLYVNGQLSTGGMVTINNTGVALTSWGDINLASGKKIKYNGSAIKSRSMLIFGTTTTPWNNSFLVIGSGPAQSDEIYIPVPMSGTITSMIIEARAPSGLGVTDTFTVRRGGVNTGMAVVLSNNNMGTNNNSFGVNAGDILSVKFNTDGATSTDDAIVTLVYETEI